MSDVNEAVAMETEEAVPAETSTTTADGLTATPIQYRTYGKLDEKGEIVSSTLTIKRKTADDKAWKALEESGHQVLSENRITFYTVDNEEAFATLIPDAEQRVYIIQKGLATLQTAKAQQLQSEQDETTKAFVYSDQDIDLRDALNESPKRQKQTDGQKLLKMVSVLDQAELQKLLAQLNAMAAK